MNLALRKYNRIFMAGIQTHLIYRINYFILSFAQLCPIVTVLMVWFAIFDSSSQTAIKGYTMPRIVTYYLVSTLVGKVMSLWFLDYEIASDIRNGQINRFLLRPVDYLWYQWSMVLSQKAIILMSLGIPLGILYYALRHLYLPPADVSMLWIITLSSLIGLFLNFIITYCAGLIAFWLLEVSSLFFIYYILMFFLSGGMFPLDLIPQPYYGMMKWLPFQYMGFFQTKLYLGDLTWAQAWNGLFIQLLWVGILYCLARWIWFRGCHRYNAFGG